MDVEKGPKRKVATHEGATITPPPLQAEMQSSETEKLQEIERHLHLQGGKQDMLHIVI